MTPSKFQKIHWRSVPGSSGGSLGALEVQNRGQIRFMKKGPEKCAIKLTISYEVPFVLAPFANVSNDIILFPQHDFYISSSHTKCLLSSSSSYLQLLTPLVESILQRDMEIFAEYAVRERNSTK